MDGIFRRPSGVYYARLVVPARLRQFIGKTELVATTGTRDFAIAKIVGTELVAVWRRQVRAAQGLDPMDLVRISLGSPLLQESGLLPLKEVASAAGLEAERLLALAAEFRIGLYVKPNALAGYLVPYSDLDRDAETGGFDVPPPRLMPSSALYTEQPGALRISRADCRTVHDELTQGRDCKLMLFEVVGKPTLAFAPKGGLSLIPDVLKVSPREVDAERIAVAARITPEQLGQARTERPAVVGSKFGHKRCSEAVEQYMRERSMTCNEEQARRVRGACDLFVELTGNPRLSEIDRDFLRRYRDEMLPKVPSHENKIRLKYRTANVKDSIAAVEGINWPRISESERAKRMQWLAGMFEWLARERWIDHDPAVGLGAAIRPRDVDADHAKRDLFTDEEIREIFTATWFQTGHGERTKEGTYREFLPYYYWLPLLGMYTGARINELCQLSLSDIRISPSGTWFIDINEHDEDNRKKVKNKQSRRLIPMHPELVRLGLPEWRNRLEAEGHKRLFPELSYDRTKGYSKAAVKWFSGYLARLDWERNNRKVFHSFRHTLASYCLNKLRLSEALTAQISGHQRSTSVLGATYRKDEPPRDVVDSIARVRFDLPSIAEFNHEKGVAALTDALRRKRARGQPQLLE